MSRVDLICDPSERVRVSDAQLENAMPLYRDGRSIPDGQRYVNSHFWRYVATGKESSKKVLATAGLVTNFGAYDFTVPRGTSADFISLRQQYGTFERECRKVPVATEIGNIPKEGTEGIGYWMDVDNDSSITASDLSFASIDYRLRKLASLSYFSSELAQDSVADFGGIVERSMAQTFAAAIDQAAWNGDGTSTYGHCLGYANALHSDSIKTASTATPTSLVAADFAGCLAKLQKFDSTPKWYMHPAVLYGVCMNTLEEHIGIDNDKIFFMGLEVETVNVLHSTLTSSTGVMLCYAGSVADSGVLVHRGEIKVVQQDSSGAAYDNDMIAVRCTQRMQPIIHGRGATARDRAMVGLRLA